MEVKMAKRRRMSGAKDKKIFRQTAKKSKTLIGGPTRL